MKFINTGGLLTAARSYDWGSRDENQSIYEIYKFSKIQKIQDQWESLYQTRFFGPSNENP